MATTGKISWNKAEKIKMEINEKEYRSILLTSLETQHFQRALRRLTAMRLKKWGPMPQCKKCHYNCKIPNYPNVSFVCFKAKEDKNGKQ